MLVANLFIQEWLDDDLIVKKEIPIDVTDHILTFSAEAVKRVPNNLDNSSLLINSIDAPKINHDGPFYVVLEEEKLCDFFNVNELSDLTDEIIKEKATSYAKENSFGVIDFENSKGAKIEIVDDKSSASYNINIFDNNMHYSILNVDKMNRNNIDYDKLESPNVNNNGQEYLLVKNLSHKGPGYYGNKFIVEELSSRKCMDIYDIGRKSYYYEKNPNPKLELIAFDITNALGIDEESKLFSVFLYDANNTSQTLNYNSYILYPICNIYDKNLLQKEDLNRLSSYITDLPLDLREIEENVFKSIDKILISEIEANPDFEDSFKYIVSYDNKDDYHRYYMKREQNKVFDDFDMSYEDLIELKEENKLKI